MLRENLVNVVQQDLIQLHPEGPFLEPGDFELRPFYHAGTGLKSNSNLIDNQLTMFSL